MTKPNSLEKKISRCQCGRRWRHFQGPELGWSLTPGAGGGEVGSFLGVLSPHGLRCGGRFHMEEWGSSTPLATLSLCGLPREEAFGVRPLGGARVGWCGQGGPGARILGIGDCLSGRAGALQMPSAWQTSLPVSPDLGEREEWGKHGTFCREWEQIALADGRSVCQGQGDSCPTRGRRWQTLCRSGSRGCRRSSMEEPSPSTEPEAEPQPLAPAGDLLESSGLFLGT